MNKYFILLCFCSLLSGAKFAIEDVRAEEIAQEFIPVNSDGCVKEDGNVERGDLIEFTVVTYNPVISKSDFEGMSECQRFPAALKQISSFIEIRESHVNSEFIRNCVIGLYDITTLFGLYDLEMMDKLHTHDEDRVLEKYLKKYIDGESNEDMANMAHSMYVNEFWKALKLIVDEKFSFDSLLNEPIYYKDLRYLMKHGAKHFFPNDFMIKVLKLAKPEAVARYNSLRYR